MSNTQAYSEFAARMDRAEGCALNPQRSGEEHRHMLAIADELQNCGYADIEERAQRLLAHNKVEATLDLLIGYASNPNRKAGAYRDAIPMAEQLLHCGFADIEHRARQVIQELMRKQNAAEQRDQQVTREPGKKQSAKEWWQFWK